MDEENMIMGGTDGESEGQSEEIDENYYDYSYEDTEKEINEKIEAGNCVFYEHGTFVSDNENNEQDGPGKFLFLDDTICVGTFDKYGKSVGEVILMFTDSTCGNMTLENGDFKGGKFSGQGKLFYIEDGIESRSGHWENGKLEGEGTITYSNGGYLNANFKNGLAEGLGELRDGDRYYTANYKNGKMEEGSKKLKNIEDKEEKNETIEEENNETIEEENETIEEESNETIEEENETIEEEENETKEEYFSTASLSILIPKESQTELKDGEKDLEYQSLASDTSMSRVDSVDIFPNDPVRSPVPPTHPIRRSESSGEFSSIHQYSIRKTKSFNSGWEIK